MQHTHGTRYVMFWDKTFIFHTALNPQDNLNQLACMNLKNSRTPFGCINLFGELKAFITRHGCRVRGSPKYENDQCNEVHVLMVSPSCRLAPLPPKPMVTPLVLSPGTNTPWQPRPWRLAPPNRFQNRSVTRFANRLSRKPVPVSPKPTKP